MTWTGWTRNGTAGRPPRGMARRGVAGCDATRCGGAWQAWRGSARLGKARPDMEWQARHVAVAGYDGARRVPAGLGPTRRDMARQARLGSTCGEGNGQLWLAVFTCLGAIDGRSISATMKTLLLIAALLLTVIVATAGNYPQQKTWEYKFDDKCSEKRSNDLAAQGWELTSMSMGTWGNISTPTCVFKRAK